MIWNIYVFLGLFCCLGFLGWAAYDDMKKGEIVNMTNPIFIVAALMMAVPILNLFLIYFIYKLATR